MEPGWVGDRERVQSVEMLLWAQRDWVWCQAGGRNRLVDVGDLDGA